MLTKSGFMALALWILASGAVVETTPPSASTLRPRQSKTDSADASHPDLYVTVLPSLLSS
ncbi:MAG TPA: hypothetical protein VGL89_00045 [Candidatus Koribacter sp.]|jgi:hypothetical protein